MAGEVTTKEAQYLVVGDVLPAMDIFDQPVEERVHAVTIEQAHVRVWVLPVQQGAELCGNSRFIALDREVEVVG